MPSKKISGDLKYLGIRFRLTALFVTIFGITLVVFSLFLFRAFEKNNLYDFDTALFNHTVDVAQSVDVDFFGELSLREDVISGGGKVFPFALGKSFLQVLSPDGRVLGRSRTLQKYSLPFTREDQYTLSRKGFLYRTVHAHDIAPGAFKDDISFRMITYLASDGPIPRFVLQIAVPQTFLEQERKNLLLYFFIGIPVTLVVAMLGGLFLSRRALSPVSGIIGKLRKLQASNLSERIPTNGPNDEIRALSLTLNELLDRLQQAFESQERFVADASHQLKTPLAILRGEVDVFRTKPRTQEELKEFIDSLSQELSYLCRMVEDLLFLARMDAGAGCLSIQKVRLDEVGLEAVSRLEPLARSRGVKIRFDLEDGDGDAPYEVAGDRDLLRSMLQSILENAIKYSPADAAVEMRVKEDSDRVVTDIRDQGKGIAPETLPRIFDPFVRADFGKDGAPGLGLGLAIARRIADAHRADLRVAETGPSGTRFQFEIKKV